MSIIKKFDIFINELLMAKEQPVTTPQPKTTPAPSTPGHDTPLRPRPTRPGFTPIETPSERDAPMAMAEPEKAPDTTPTAPPPTTEPDTPLRQRPSRPGITPIETPSERDAPLALGKRVIMRFSDLFRELDMEEKNKINSYFNNEKF